jgi:D-3-phosphoglycerate dehydrogenase
MGFDKIAKHAKQNKRACIMARFVEYPEPAMSRLRAKVLLTNPIDAEGIAIIEAVADVVVAPDTRHETLLKLVANADALLVRAYLPQNIFDTARRLRGVVRYGVGLDMIPVEAATAKAIPVANVPGVNAGAVAEYCLSGMLLMTRRMHRMNHDLRTGDWPTSRMLSDEAVELSGRTVGIVGVGNIGRRVAEICHGAFHMRVLGHLRRLDALPSIVAGVDIDTLCRDSDFIILSCPLTPQTQNLISAARIASMKRCAAVINVARGQVIDEAALVNALSDQRIGGAVLDVYQEQPLPRDHPLLTLDNVVLTPHVAGLTRDSMRRMSIGSAQEVVRLLNGERPLNFVNPQIWAQHLARIQGMDS